MLRTASVLVLLGLLMDVHPLPAASWNSLPGLPEARFGAAAAAQGNRLFVLGGFSSQPLPNATVWDHSTQGWSEAAPMSQARQFGAAAGETGFVYALGGFVDGVPTASAERLDLTSGVWSPIAAMPMGRAAFGAAFVGGALWVAGGQGEDNSPLADCFRYDPGSDTWSPVAPLPTPRSGVAVAALDGKLWVVGGMDAAPSAMVERFDPLSGGWSPAASLPEPLWFPAAAAFDGRLWVAGGMDVSFQRSDRVYSAGPDGVWRSEASLPSALATSAMGATTDCLTLVGGMDASGAPSSLAFAQGAEGSPPPPPPPPPGTDTLLVAVTLAPSTLGDGTQGNWIAAHIWPDGWSARQIHVSSLYLNGAAVDPSGPVVVDDVELEAKFPRRPFAALPAGEHVLTLVGQRSDGTPLRGSATLSVHVSGLQAKDRGRSLRPLGTAEGRGVAFTLRQAEAVRVEVIDLQGRRVERFDLGWLPAGEHRVEWPQVGRAVARGAYFVRLERPSAVDVVRLFVVR